jgi:hypothetical protein
MIALHPIGSVNPLPHRSAELTAAALPGQGGENYLETLLNSPSPGGRGLGGGGLESLNLDISFFPL